MLRNWEAIEESNGGFSSSFLFGSAIAAVSLLDCVLAWFWEFLEAEASLHILHMIRVSCIITFFYTCVFCEYSTALDYAIGSGCQFQHGHSPGRYKLHKHSIATASDWPC